MAGSLKSFIDDVSALVSPPEVWFRINEVVNDPRSAASDVAEVTARDPSLTAKLLKVVNSPFFNFPTRVDTVSRAVTILGTGELFSLVTAITAAKVFSNIPNNLVKPATFWRHSICTGLIARRLAHQCNVLHPERIYIAGMLHDIGSLLLYRKFPDKATQALLAADGNEQVLYTVERDYFGFNHAEVGAELLRRWNLPSTLVNAIKFHHEPPSAPEAGLEAALLQIADTIANRFEYSCFTEGKPDPDGEPDPAAWQVTGLDSSTQGDADEGLEDELAAAVAVFLPQGMGKS